MTRTSVSALAATAAVAIGLGGIALAQAPNPPGVDPTHYQCYRVSQIKQIKAKSVKLADQFTKQTAQISRATFVCAPVEKNGEPPKDKDTHLTCYTVPAKNAGKKVRMIHQLGEHDLAVGGSVFMCLPSIKKIL
jgi:hypothetical protein